ncbi:MAG: hypothetical protein CSA03_03595 [Bacteroidetes bacterium]|nr:MAG: hypothetical protein CSA03_03595 [Bacteroidota bacterium]
MKNSIRLLLLATPMFLISLITYSQDGMEKIWVTFTSHDDVPITQENQLFSRNESIQTLIDDFSITSVKQALPASERDALQHVYEVTCQCDISELSNEINKGETPLDHPEPAPKYELLNEPNDYSLNFSPDYALELINATEAWSYSTGDPTIVIGISDANYYDVHEDLEGKIVYLDPINNSTNYYHGTAVAITAAGHTNNNIGKSSIGYDCSLYLTVTDYNKVIEMSQLGVRVINISWVSACFDSPYIQAIIDEAYDNGAILVAAAGNGNTCGGSTNLVFPASCNHVISVTSIGSQDNHERVLGDPTTTHQHNSRVDICAPGYDVPLSIAPGYYNTSNGSSFAAPFVSGTIGLMLSLRPCLTFEEVETILKETADDIYPSNPSYMNQLGAGRLNAGKALDITRNYCQPQVVSGTSGTLSGNGTNNGNVIDPTNDSLNLTNNQGSDLSPNSSNIMASVAEIHSTKINLFPNPTSNQSTLKWENTEATDLLCYDSKGTLIEQKHFATNTTETSISTDESGVYLLKLVRNQEIVWHGRLVRL